MIFMKDNIEKINRVLLECVVIVKFEADIANVNDLHRSAMMECKNSVARFEASLEATISGST